MTTIATVFELPEPWSTKRLRLAAVGRDGTGASSTRATYVVREQLGAPSMMPLHRSAAIGRWRRAAQRRLPALGSGGRRQEPLQVRCWPCWVVPQPGARSISALAGAPVANHNALDIAGRRFLVVPRIT